jgi:hypothetical protein
MLFSSGVVFPSVGSGAAAGSKPVEVSTVMTAGGVDFDFFSPSASGAVGSVSAMVVPLLLARVFLEAIDEKQKATSWMRLTLTQLCVREGKLRRPSAKNLKSKSTVGWLPK